AADGRPQVRLLGMLTDVAKRYRWVVPPLPIPPFRQWRKWFKEHEESVHCALEWRDEKGQWVYAEMRSIHLDPRSERSTVGRGEFPGTAFDAYAVYIVPGRAPRDVDVKGRPVTVTLDEEVPCDCHCLEREIRSYAAKDKSPGDLGTGGAGERNVGLGGP